MNSKKVFTKIMQGNPENVSEILKSFDLELDQVDIAEICELNLKYAKQNNITKIVTISSFLIYFIINLLVVKTRQTALVSGLVMFALTLYCAYQYYCLRKLSQKIIAMIEV